MQKGDNAQPWKGNEFMVETHLRTLLGAPPRCVDRSSEAEERSLKSRGAGANSYKTVPSGGESRLTVHILWQGEY